MKLHEQVETINTKADLVEFIEALAADLRRSPTTWENPTLEAFLMAFARWLEDSDGYYQNRGLEVPASPSWRNIAEMLMAAKMYE